jgi:hypothetical protein
MLRNDDSSVSESSAIGTHCGGVGAGVGGVGIEGTTNGSKLVVLISIKNVFELLTVIEPFKKLAWIMPYSGGTYKRTIDPVI